MSQYKNFILTLVQRKDQFEEVTEGTQNLILSLRNGTRFSKRTTKEGLRSVGESNECRYRGVSRNVLDFRNQKDMEM